MLEGRAWVVWAFPHLIFGLLRAGVALVKRAGLDE